MKVTVFGADPITRVRCAHVGRTGVHCHRTTATGTECAKHAQRGLGRQCSHIAYMTGERCRRGATTGSRCKSHSRIEAQEAAQWTAVEGESKCGGPTLTPCRMCRIPLLPRQVAEHRCERITIDRWAGKGLGSWAS